MSSAAEEAASQLGAAPAARRCERPGRISMRSAVPMRHCIRDPRRDLGWLRDGSVDSMVGRARCRHWLGCGHGPHRSISGTRRCVARRLERTRWRAAWGRLASVDRQIVAYAKASSVRDLGNRTAECIRAGPISLWTTGPLCANWPGRGRGSCARQLRMSRGCAVARKT